MSDAEYQYFLTFMNEETQNGEESCKKLLEPITKMEKKVFLSQFSGLVLSSDAFFPFRDSIDQASMIGIKYVGTSVESAGLFCILITTDSRKNCGTIS